jgi:hypothetical protein
MDAGSSPSLGSKHHRSSSEHFLRLPTHPSDPAAREHVSLGGLILPIGQLIVWMYLKGGSNTKRLFSSLNSDTTMEQEQKNDRR